MRAIPRLYSLAIAALLGVSGTAAAVPAIDGQQISAAAYGPARSVQAVETQFGDNLSELDAAWGVITAGHLYLALTGNIESNYNVIEIFIDSLPGVGESPLSGVPGNNGAGVMRLSFDVGFRPDYHLFVRRGPDASGDTFKLDFARLGSVGFSSYVDLFGGAMEGSGATGTGLNGSPILVGYDDGNTAGVAGGTAAANQAAALAVTTGLELSISLSDIGNPTGAIKVLAFVNGSNHDYASNQFLGPLTPPQGNLGSDGTGTFSYPEDFDLNEFTGLQFFLVPQGIEHFFYYGATGPDGPPVDVEDQFGPQPQGLDLGPVVSFLVPVAKNAELVANDASHLTGYAMPGVQPDVAHVIATHQFGSWPLQIGPAVQLLVPTQVPDGPQGPLEIDHFACYEASGHSLDQTVSLVDFFHPGTGVARVVRRPFLFCNPAAKNEEGIFNSEDHLTCYRTEPVGTPVGFLLIQNQFSPPTPYGIEVESDMGLCLPSKKQIAQIDVPGVPEWGLAALAASLLCASAWLARRTWRVA